MGDGRTEAERREAERVEERRIAELGNRPVVETLLPILERLEAERRALDMEAEPTRLEAGKAIAAKDFRRAAALYGDLARHYRAYGFRGDAEQYEKRAADCVSCARLSKKGKRGGR